MRLNFPLTSSAGAHQGRSGRTCELKCGSACFHPVPNTSKNAYFGDIAEAVISRRGLMKGSASAVLLAGLAGGLGAGTLVATRPTAAEASAAAGTTGLGFTPIASPPAETDALVVPDGYASLVLIRWGDPVVSGAPRFDFANQSAAAQERQFGFNCDYVGFFPLAPGDADALGRSKRGLLAVNHEYSEEDRMFPDLAALDPVEVVNIGLAAHGMTIIEIQRSRGATGGFFYLPDSRYNRRITATTPMRLTGPAAGSPLLATSADPTGTRVLGTLNNCAGGNTPWGTVLTAEENFNQYFANQAAMPEGQNKAAHARYGLPEGPSARLWETVYDRFDLTKQPNEPNRFGWVVEIDPYDPGFVPRKRTALGRVKHEGASIALAADHRAVAYMGDDERFDYVYKFVSRRSYVEGEKAANLGLLDEGDLYVASFTGDSPAAEIERYNATVGELPDDGKFDGSGEWIPLVSGGVSRVAGFSVAEVLVRTRLAADTVGATKMDRPEDVQVNPVNGYVYMAMTNNTNRGTPTNPGVDEANPRRVDGDGAVTGNKYGHVVELREDGDDAAAATFTWELFLVCGDPTDPTTYFQGVDKRMVSPISAPDNVAFDNQGNLWIATDGAPGTIGKADAFHAVPVEGPDRGKVMQFLSVPAGAEACGPEFTPDNGNLFVAVQHPGDGQPSSWPDGGGNPPRPSVASIYKPRGNKVIGT